MSSTPRSHASELLALLVLCTLGASCALNKEILVSSTPVGADVFIDGRRVGRTPLTIETDDLMPNRGFDGKISARSVVTVEKEGYSTYRQVLREFSLPDNIHAQLAAPSLASNFEDFTESNPELSRRTLVASQPAAVYPTDDMDAECETLFRRGFVMTGFAGAMGEPVPTQEVVRFATSKGAHIALVSSRFAGVTTEARAVTTHIAGTVASSFATGSAHTRHRGTGRATAWGPNGTVHASGSYSGTTATNASASGFTIVPASARTDFIPFARRHFDTQITLWRKRTPTVSGAYTDTIPVELRAVLGRNTGAYVVAVEDGSPAFRADLLPGDVIVAVGGTKIYDPEAFNRSTAHTKPARITLDVIRAGTERQVPLDLR